MSTDTPAPASAPPDRYVAVQQSDEFVGLRKALRGFVFPMTAAFFLWYALYVILSAYARDFMGTKLVGNINVALVFGLLQFVSTFLIAWLYSRFAASKLDPTADRIRAELEGAAGSHDPAGTVTPDDEAQPKDKEVTS
ncbi:DUF485 domain-containing protein [Plantactinospora sp. S1510]|uniref:DUF485 domain-containing protein n=1 Tax=Plantactinospora alkalitolerans TaxID=2789879 RepID=A0ABS0GY28_9ACTN|nr:DUF485 domain-containing protein [Plantactinospora alkalitolerans]MBF9131118.1 DUF485 domain-containing protein [Plantactinospora alkalitolerans]